MRRVVHGLVLLVMPLACARSEPSSQDRRDPTVVASQPSDDDALHFVGEVEFANGGRITARAIWPAELRPTRTGEPGTPLQLVLTSEGLG